MDLPLMPPVAPMLAKPVPQLPDGPWSFEPKWDGFRTIVFPNGDEVELGSRKERPMTRCFPGVVEAVRANLSARCVVDAEGNKIVVDFLTREPVATVAPIRRTPKPMASPG